MRERHRKTTRIANIPVVYPAVRYYDARFKHDQDSSGIDNMMLRAKTLPSRQIARNFGRSHRLSLTPSLKEKLTKTIEASTSLKGGQIKKRKIHLTSTNVK